MCPVAGCLTPAQTLHVRPANYRRSCCCALALHALDAHGCHGVTTFETTVVCVLAAYQLWWIVVVLGRGMEPRSVLDRNPSACGRSCRECWRPVHGQRCLARAWADLVQRERTRRRSIWLNVLECHGGAVVRGKIENCTGGGKVR